MMLMLVIFLMVVNIYDSLARYVFQFLLVFFPKVADQVLTEQVSLGKDDGYGGDVGQGNDGDDLG